MHRMERGSPLSLAVPPKTLQAMPSATLQVDVGLKEAVLVLEVPKEPWIGGLEPTKPGEAGFPKHFW